MPHRSSLLIFLLAWACTSGHPTEDLDEPAPPVEVELPAATISLSSMQPEQAPVVQTTARYAGWQGWCEPEVYETPCKENVDCADLPHVARRPLRCIRPRWSEKDDVRNADGSPLKICAPGFSARQEQAWRQARLRELVAQAYFDEPKHCPDWSWEPGRRSFARKWENGRPTHEQHWRCTQELAPAQKLADFLWVPYLRETTARPWKRHRLDPDQQANEQAWVRLADRYGWQVNMACDNGRKRCSKAHKVIVDYYPDPKAEVFNPHYGDRHRWQGLGGYGKNSALGVSDWDRLAPPEILCLEVPGTEAYLRDARHGVEVFRGSGAPCPDGRYHGRAIRVVDGVEQTVAEPSWIDVHRVASGGKFCPRDTKYEGLFRKRMQAVGLNPDEPVTLDMLGRQIPRATQHETADQILARLEAVLAPPWRVPGGDVQAVISTGSTR